MRRAVAARSRTYLRKPGERDAAVFVRGVAASRDHLEPFVFAPDDETGYRGWIARGDRADVEQYLVCRRDDDAVVGFVTLNDVRRGSQESGAAGWAGFQPHLGVGHLTDGLGMLLELAFTQLRLHRVEANIQPANIRSRALAVRCGFHLEGYSPAFLRIDGQWRDHERWAILAEHWRSGVGAASRGAGE